MKKKYGKPHWKGYLAVHETISGFSCFLCNDEDFARTVLTIDRLHSLQLSCPRGYKLSYKKREDAEAMLNHIAKLNKFTEILKP